MDKTLVPQDEVGLQPLAQSHEADQVERELKALFMKLYADLIRPDERRVNTVGMPHLGPFDQVEQAVKADGLALLRQGVPDAMRYVFKAWRARNPKRGLHMLRLYLQLLWPNSWTMNQLWQLKSGTYPDELAIEDGGDHFLTSRVAVKISAGITDGADVAAMVPALRSVVPARLLLGITIEQVIDSEMAVANGGYQGLVLQQFEGDFDRLDQPWEVGQAAYRGGAIHFVTGDFQ